MIYLNEISYMMDCILFFKESSIVTEFLILFKVNGSGTIPLTIDD